MLNITGILNQACAQALAINRTNSVSQTQQTVYVDMVQKKKPTKFSQAEKNYEMVHYMIEQDKDKDKNINIEKMTTRIINAANAVGIKPELLAAIVKNESHFSEKIKNVASGKGPAGITSSPPKSMYNRPELYDNRMAELIEKYGSLSKVFAQKNKTPKLDLGAFGNMLYKYKSWDKLYSAVQKDFDLNLRVGSYYFKYMLKKYKGNERQAFYHYNGSNNASNYAQKAVASVSNTRSGVERRLLAKRNAKQGLNVKA